MISFSSIGTKIKIATVGTYRFAWAHKIISAVVLIALIGGGYYAYASYTKSHTAAQYGVTAAYRGMLAVTVAASGQVSAEHQLTLTPKNSGTITSVDVVAGQQVTAGQLIATVDNTDAENSLISAKEDLQSEQLSLAKNNPTSTAESATASIGLAVNDLDTALSNVDSALHSYNIPGNKLTQNVFYFANLAKTPDADALENEYSAAQSSYNVALSASEQLNQQSSTSDIQEAANKTHDAAVALALVTKDTLNEEKGAKTELDNEHAVTTSLASQISSLVTSLSDANSAISSMTTAAENINGTSIDNQTDALTLQQREQAVTQAEQNLENYVVRAPFAGTIADVDVKKFDPSGSKVATLITNESYAVLSLNEVDAAKIAAGQKASLTFDAIDGLTISGTVAEVDTIGTVSSGVVSYSVKIGFDQEDPRVKPGMTVNAVITTASKDDALLVPSSAIKTTNGQSYVEVVSGGSSATGTGSTTATSSAAQRARFASTTDATASSTAGLRFASTTAFASRGSGTQTVSADAVTLTRVPVKIGLTNDTLSEITSGLNTGDRVVTSTLTAAGTATKTGSILNLLGGSRAPATGTAGARTTTGTGARTTGAAAGNANFRAGGAGGFGG